MRCKLQYAQPISLPLLSSYPLARINNLIHLSDLRLTSRKCVISSRLQVTKAFLICSMFKRIKWNG